MVNGEILDTFLLKTRNKKLPFDPAIPLLGLHPKKPETRIRNLCAPMFIAVLFTIAKCQKQPKCLLVNEWIKKLLVHLYNKILHRHGKEGNLIFSDSINGQYYAK